MVQDLISAFLSVEIHRYQREKSSSYKMLIIITIIYSLSVGIIQASNVPS